MEREILDLIEQYGWIDGAHHKQWVLDQIVRKILAPNDYEKWAEACNWDCGIAP